MNSLIKNLLKENGHAPSSEGNEPPGNDENNNSQQEPPAQVEPGSNNEPPADVPPAPNYDDLPEDIILKVLNKKRGTNFTTLDEVTAPAPVQTELTEDQKREQAIERQNSIRTYALQNKKVTSTDFDQYAQESTVPYVDLALDLYKNERLEQMRKSGVAEANLPDDKELETEFNDLNFQYADANDPKRLKAEARLKGEVEGYLQDKYANIYNLEDEYDSHQQVQTQRTNYNNTVNQVFDQAQTEFSELSFDIMGEDNKPVSYKFKPKSELFTSLRSKYNTDDSFNMLGQGTLNADVLKSAVKNSLISAAFNEIISEIANAHRAAGMAEVQRGRRNIPDRENNSGGGGATKVTNPVVKKILDENKHSLTN